METMRQGEPGSGEGQHMGTVDDAYRMERPEAPAMQSPSPLVTIFYSSIPAGMLGRASISIKGIELTGNKLRSCLAPLAPRSSCLAFGYAPGCRVISRSGLMPYILENAIYAV